MTAAAVCRAVVAGGLMLAAVLVSRAASPEVPAAGQLVLPPDIPAADRRAGSDFMSAESRDLQADDTASPAMLWVLDGQDLWSRPAGPGGASCASCHGATGAGMAGVAVRYPAFDASEGRPVDLAGRINLCRSRYQRAEPLRPESRDLLALEAFVARQSRGMPVAAVDDPRLAPALDRGGAFYWQRQGQLNLSCGSCHSQNWGRYLGSAVIPQGHPTGYPLYRLEWQSLGSLQRRLRNCLSGIRAEAFAFDAPELIDLEVFLRQRAAGLVSDAPAVRP